MKKFLVSLAFCLIAFLGSVKAQMNVGSTAAPDPSSMLQVSSTTGGFRPPQVSLSNAGVFCLTSPVSPSVAYGMIVYNTNGNISSTNAYPAHGVGDYWWDSLGWVPLAFRNPTELVSFGSASGNTLDNTNTGALNLGGTRYISTANAVITGGGSILQIVTAGVYKIDIDCRASNVGSTSNTGNTTGNTAIFTSYLYNGSTLLTSGSITQTFITGNLSNDYVYMHVCYSYIGSFAALSNLTIKAISEGMPGGVNSTFEVVALYVQHIQ